MTSISPSPQPVPAPHVRVERKVTPSTRDSRATNVVSPSSPQRPALATNKRYSNVQSKVGSLDTINYKPKASEKKVQSFKQDFSHIKSKVDAKLILPTDAAEGDGTAASTPGSPPTSIAAAAATRTTRGVVSSTRPAVSSTAPSRSNSASQPKPLSRSASMSSAATASIKSPTTATARSPRSPPQSPRNGSTTSLVASPPTSSSSSTPARRISKHIIPTQKLQFDHVKSKVGSFDNISYASRGRASSQSSSTDEGALSPSNGRSRSPSAMSSTSSTGNAATGPGTGATSPGRRPSFRIPATKKVDYSKVRSKVGSLDYVHHVPQGGNLKVFSEKLSFRETAQSKIAKEINITQFYQSDQSFDTSTQEAGEHLEGEQDQSIIYGSEADAEDFEPPKNILAVLEEVTEAVGDLGLEGEEQYQQDQEQDQENQYEHEQEPEQEHGHDTQGAYLESVAAL